MASRALIAIDVQNGFVTQSSAHVVAPIAALIDNAHRTDQPVVVTRFINTPKSPFERFMGWDAMKVAPQIDLHPQIRQVLAPSDLLLAKSGYGAITPELAAYFADLGVQEVILCGIDTECCVLATAVQAFEHGLRPLVLTDLCASNGGQHAHDAGLTTLRRLVGPTQLLTSDQLD
jgi:nicotinamidase-related amidase